MSAASTEKPCPANGTDMTLKIKEIIRANGITDKVSEVIVKDAGLAGEGFASQTRCITVKYEDPNRKPLNLFAKVVTPNKSHTQFIDELKAFDKEATFLTNYVPAAKRMCKQKGFEGLADLYPKCYYGDSTMIIMENLVLDKGYCLLDKSERQDIEAAKFAIETLAKHHAISYAMIQEEGGAENFFKRFVNLDHEGFDKPIFATMMGPSLANALKSNIKILEKSDVEGKKDALDVLNAFKEVTLLDLVVASLNCDENELLLLGHGDYWNNNMMFLKDKETNKIIGHKAIDLQVTRYNSPALDLGYFLFTSVRTDVRIAHLKDLLEFYLNILKKVSSDLGHPISLTYDQLFQSYRKKFQIGFWFCMMIVIGPGMAVMKDLDITKVDMKDWAAVFDQLMQKWLEENPHYSKIITEELVKLAKEYKDLSIN